MAALYFSKLFSTTLLASLFLLASSQAFDDERKVYIVYMGSIETGIQSTSSYHYNMLQDIVDKRFVGESLVRSYTRSFNGFAAKFTEQEREHLTSHEEVVSIFPSTTFYPQTTRSWEFTGLTENVHRNPTSESDIIIGVIDTGIWPESHSFSDEGFGPPPKKWKGACNGGKNFTCNNKLIGARYYVTDTARDTQGHGSHTSSIAAGNYVKGVSFNGIAEGTARGGVPSARIAAYKVCGFIECSTESILAAFDDAIADGVDIITISIGSRTASELVTEPTVIGAMHATQKGILVTQSAGNSGDLGSGAVQSVAPWIFSVAATSTDRGIVSKVVLGNGATLVGKTINSFDLMDKAFPLVYGRDASNFCAPELAKSCLSGCLNSKLVKGKFVLCDNYSNGITNAFISGALGAIVQTDFNVNVSSVVPFPASKLSKQDFKAIESYYYANGKSVPPVKILASESIKNLDAPRVASFSSRGPNKIIPNILKPDITAPGVEILAAYSPEGSPSSVSDRRSVEYSVISGTSMSCPHVAGAAAYVKSIHPNWSPSAIRSALMTTAWRMNPALEPLAEFSYGAGHIDPVRAADPGLVHETPIEDYVKMLCGLNYNISTIERMFGGNTTCPSGNKLMAEDLNYPSMAVQIPKKNESEVALFSANFTRTVTNVGGAKSIYDVTTSKSSDYNITVSPNKLTFAELNEKKSYQVVISGNLKGSLISASIEWSDGVRKVRSPIVVYSS